MGYFSWKCKGCEGEICEPEVAVLVDEEGIVARGEYDGYGRLGEYEIEDFDPVIWHFKCFKEAPKSEQEDMKSSKNAPNQGCGEAKKEFC
jgi:hypothetical protein